MKAPTLGLVAALTMIASPAFAQDEHRLYYVQAGAMLNYADAEVRILHAAVSARVYDPTVTKQAIEQIEMALVNSKRQVDRAATLLPEKLMKYEDELLGLRNKIVQAERQLASFKTVLETEIAKSEEPEEEEETLSESDDEETPAPPAEEIKTDWKAIRDSAAWIAQDVKACKSDYAVNLKRLAIRALPFPRKPAGAHPEN